MAEIAKKPFNMNIFLSELLGPDEKLGIKTVKLIKDPKGNFTSVDITMSNGDIWGVQCARKPMTYRKQNLK